MPADAPPADREPVSAPAAPLDDRLDALKKLVPEAFVGDRLDAAKLAAALGQPADPDAPERMTFEWAGKRKAVKELGKPATGTLRPDRNPLEQFDSAPHVFIEGENLETLKLLYRSYAGRVKLVLSIRRTIPATILSMLTTSRTPLSSTSS